MATAGLVEQCLKKGVEEFVLLFDREKNPVEILRFDGAVQAITDAALDYLIAALDGEKQACPVALPIAEYQVLNGRF